MLKKKFALIEKNKDIFLKCQALDYLFFLQILHERNMINVLVTRVVNDDVEVFIYLYLFCTNNFMSTKKI